MINLEFDINWHQSLIYTKLSNFFFFLKKKKINLYKKKFIIFKEDLFFRFPQVSYLYTNQLKIMSWLIKKKLKKIQLLFYEYSLNTLFFRITPVGGIASYKENMLKRLHQLTVGSFSHLPLNYTYSGYFMPFLFGRKKQCFFTKVSNFLFIRRYITFLEKLDRHYYGVKSSNIFPTRTPNLTLKILYFYFSGKKVNFIRNNIIFKQYKIFKTFKKDFKLFDTNWFSFDEHNSDVSGLKSFRTPVSNIRLKQKHILKFYRLSTNIWFNTKYKSHTLTHFFNNLSSNVFKSPYKHFKNELSLVIFLVKIHFALNFDDSRFLIENGYVFINGKVCYNRYFMLKIYDRVQLINCFDEYIHYRFLLSSIITKKARALYTVKKLFLTKGRHYKTQPNLFKKWPIKIIWSLVDIPRFVEIDFLTFTAILVYLPLSHIDFFKFFKEDYNSHMIRMYNWKYYY